MRAPGLKPKMSGVRQGDPIVDERVNHAEGNERVKIGVKRGKRGLGGVKLLKTGGGVNELIGLSVASQAAPEQWAPEITTAGGNAGPFRNSHRHQGRSAT